MRSLTLITPAIIGLVILGITIPTMASVLSVATALEGTPDSVFIDTDCDGILVSVWLDPEGSPSMSDYEPPPGVGSLLEIDIDGRVTSPGCTRIGLVLSAASGRAPILLDASSDGVSHLPDLVDGTNVLEIDPEVRTILTFEWPGLYRFSERGYGLGNFLVGPRVGGVNFYVDWPPAGESVKPSAMLVDTYVNAPTFLDFSFASDAQLVEMSQGNSVWSNGNESPDLNERMFATVRARFETSDYEAKTNYVLIAGGAAIGLGLTFIVESLIAVLFRLERLLVVRTRKTPSPSSNDDREPVSSEQPSGDVPSGDDPDDGDADGPVR